ncbi:MAG: DsrE family protein [Gammaproteobacteria bacterium]|nr:DsrE family protein [Gammaproteobacteria bacterium]
MKRYMFVSLVCVAATMGVNTYANAAGNDAACPPATIASIDAEFGSGTSNITTCIKYRENVRVVINASSADTNKAGVSQQLVNVNNLYHNYEDMYGMVLGKDYDIKVVGHGKGGKWLLTDAAYNAATGTTLGNPSGAMVRDLVAHGISVYLCQNTMRANGWKTTDVIEGVHEVPAGVAAVVDFAKQGYVLLTP